MGNNKEYIEKSLKRYIKSKKIGYTASLLVSFLITGNLLYANDIKDLEAKIIANNKRIEEIEKRTEELIKEGDYYAKTLEDNKQFFFPLNIEHRHARKGHHISWDYVKPNEPNKELKDYIKVGKPKLPAMPIKEIKHIEITPIDFGTEESIATLVRPEVELGKKPDKLVFYQNTVGSVNVDPVDVDKYIDTDVPDFEGIKVTENLGEAKKEVFTYDYTVDYGKTPDKIMIRDIDEPKSIDLPDIKIAGTKFNQGYGGVIAANIGNSASVIENYAKFTTDSDGMGITFTGDSISYENKDGLTINTAEYIKKNGEKVESQILTDKAKNDFRNSFISGTLLGTFISHTMARELNVNGTYNINYTGDTGNTNRARTFLSVNMSGMGIRTANDLRSYNSVGLEDGTRIYPDKNNETISNGKVINDIKLGELNENLGIKVVSNATINLKNTTDGSLIAIDHQILDDFIFKNDANRDKKEKDYLNTFSILKNAGNINLGEDNSHKNMIGITIESESAVVGMEEKATGSTPGNNENHYRNFKGLMKFFNDATINEGKIKINGDTSIGIGYETGEQVSSDLYVGDVELGDTSTNSYGVRMKNVWKNNNLLEDPKTLRSRTKTNFNHYDSARVFGYIGDNKNLDTEIDKMADKKLEIEINDGVAEANRSQKEDVVNSLKDKFKDDSTTVKSINVGGKNNGGFVVAESLSAYAERYLKKDSLDNISDEELAKFYDYASKVDYTLYSKDMTAEQKKNNLIKNTDGTYTYLGYFNGDVADNNYEGYELGKVNPIANIHGLQIEVNGESGVGFLRHKDYSSNNTNDMIITDTETAAIKNIDFGEKATGSVLIRSDMYGIDLRKNLKVNGDGIEDKNIENKAEDKEDKSANIILQATKTTWTKDNIVQYYEKDKTDYEAGNLDGVKVDPANNGLLLNKRDEFYSKDSNRTDGIKNKNDLIRQTVTKEVVSIGHVANNAIVSSTMDNVIGMMANVSETKESKAEDKKDIERIFLNDYKGYEGKEKAAIINSNKIDLSGKNAIGMAVLHDSYGLIYNGHVDTTMLEHRQESENKEDTTFAEETDYNIGVYNAGEFDIKNATVMTSGKGSATIYNTAEMTLGEKVNTLDENENIDTIKNNIIAKNGAVALYSKGGNVNSYGNINISSHEGIGIYAESTPDKNVNINIVGENNKIEVTNGMAGISAIGKDNSSNDTTNSSLINIENTILSYSGSGYALHTEGDGKITLKDTTVELNGNATGMRIDLNGDIKGLEFGENTKIKVNSSDAVVFNIVSDSTTNLENLSGVSNKINNAVSAVGNKVEIEAVTDEAGKEISYKEVMIDGGKLNIDKNISSADENKDGVGNYYYRKFLGQRLNITTNENINIDATIDNVTADTYYKGKVTGLEVVSSSQAESVKDSSITLSNGVSLTANRLGEEEGEYKPTVGIFGNFSTITLDGDSSIEVEKMAEGKKDTIHDGGVGIFAVNGSVVDTKENSKIITYGNESIGIYAKAYRVAEDEDGKDVVMTDEFGKNEDNNKGQGKVNVTNSGVIEAIGHGAVGIYANNNNENKDNTSSVVINNGTIKAGDSAPLQADKDLNSTIGIFAINSTIENNNTIEVIGETSENNRPISQAIGIYATENSVVSKIGDIKLSNYATGVVIEDTSKINTTEETIRFTSDDTNKSTKVGIMYQELDSENKDNIINFNIDTQGMEGARAVIAKDGTLTLAEGKTIDINGDKDSRAMAALGENEKEQVKIINKGTINLNKENKNAITNSEEEIIRSIGMSVIGENGVADNLGTINVNADHGIGIYISNEYNKTKTNELLNIGTIKLDSKNAIGVYSHTAKDTIDITKDEAEAIEFGENSEFAIGISLHDSNIEINTEIKRDLNNNNALLKLVGNSTITNNGTLSVIGKAHTIGSENARATALIMDEKNIYKNGENGKLVANDGTIGIYKKLGNTSVENLSNRFENMNIEVSSDTTKLSSLGLALRGQETGENSKALVSGSLKVEGNAIGVITRDTDLTLDNIEITFGDKKDTSPIGVFLNDKATVEKGKVTIKENESSTKEEAEEDYNIGVFASELAGHTGNVDIDINEKTSIGMYVAENKEKDSKGNDITFEYKGNINVNSKDSVGLYSENDIIVKDGSQIKVADTGDKELSSTGIYVKSASLENKGKVDVAGLRNVGLLAENINGENTTELKNSGEIKISSGTGIVAKGNVDVYNSGKIHTDNSLDMYTILNLYDGATLKSIGNVEMQVGDTLVYSKNSSIDGSKFVDSEKTKDGYGIIDISKAKEKSNAIVMDTDEGQGKDISLKNLDIKLGEEGVGVYVLDEDVNIENIKISADESKKKVTGIYLNDNIKSVNEKDINSGDTTKEFVMNKVDINLHNNSYGIIIEDGEGTNTTLKNSSIKITDEHEGHSDGVGVYVGSKNYTDSDGNIQEGNIQTLNSEKNIYTMTNAIGIYGGEESIIESKNDTYNLTGNAVGVFSKGNVLKLDENSKFTFTNGSASGIAGYLKNENIDGDNITFESKANITGSGNHLYGLFLEGNGTLENGGVITLDGDNNIGLAATSAEIEDGTIIEASENNIIKNSGTINIIGVKKEATEDKAIKSVGIYGEDTGIASTGTINVSNNALGIMYHGNNKAFAYNVEANDINLSGDLAVGVEVQGNLHDVNIKNITTTKAGNQLGFFANEAIVTEGNKINIENISLGNESLGALFFNSTGVVDIGSISVEGGKEEAIAIAVHRDINNTEDYNLKFNFKDKISAGENGVAFYNKNENVEISGVTNISVKTKPNSQGALLYLNGGTTKLSLSEKEKAMNEINIDADGHYALVLYNGSSLVADKDFKDKQVNINVKNGGIGIVFQGTDKSRDIEMGVVDIGINTVNVVGKDVNSSHTEEALYTKGIYYSKMAGTVNNPDKKIILNQVGRHTIGAILDESWGILNMDIKLTKDAQDSMGLVIRNNEHNLTEVIGNIDVSAGGMEDGNKGFGNLGMEVFRSDVTQTGNITVGRGHNFENSYPIGIFLKNIDEKETNYNYEGIGDMLVGNFATGIAGENYNVKYTGSLDIGVGAVGILVENDKYSKDKYIDVESKNITVGDTTSEDKDRVRGTAILGENIDIRVKTDKMTILANKNNMGIVGISHGDIDFTGDVEIEGNETIKDKEHNPVIGIYKEGTGNVLINKGTWNVGENALGVVVDDEVRDTKEKGNVKVINDADMNIAKSAIGIYSLGHNDILNNGNINVVGADENNIQSVGIYVANIAGSEKAYAENRGVITAIGENGLGVQIVGDATFVNEGEIKVSEKAAGIFAQGENALAVNGKNGVINLEGNSRRAVGMYAKNGATIENLGLINARDGIGMYVEKNSYAINKGTITVGSGSAIKGDGIVFNEEGTIVLEKGNTNNINSISDNEFSFANDIISVGIDKAEIGKNFVNKGGNIVSDLDLNLKNPTIDITKGDSPIFTAPNITGEVKIDPNFALSGNGYSYDLSKQFANMDVNINTSPLFIAKDKELNKVAYKDVLKDYEYKEFYNSLDATLESGLAKDIEALKKLNNYLEEFGETKEFYNEYDKVMQETRGNIYSHVQSRMQDVDRAFNNAFDEMESSYSLSKDTDKFSVIYTDGDYKSSKSQIPDYDYNIAGLLYMKEYESLEARDKYGYTFGFTGSKFKFDDSGKSKENIYSLKAGVHNVKYFSKDLNLLTKLEAGLNYHETDRKISFGDARFTNDSDFWSYHVSFDNKFRKTLFEDYQNEFGIYAGLETEYGRFTDIKEDGTLALKVKCNDYLSAKGVAGVNGTGRKYLGNDWTGKITGDAFYSYDFGHNYKANETKLRHTDGGYVSLMNEMETKGRVGAKVGIGVERLNHLGVTLEGEVGKDFERDEDYWRVGLRFNYKFNAEDATTTLRNTFNLFGNHFDFDKHDLKQKEQDIVKAGSKIIDKHNLKGTLVLEGHTDSFGSVEYNQGLSERRAETVKKELQENITKKENIKYQTKGYSKLRPIDTNETAEGRANNRRVEVKYIPEKKSK